MSTVRSPILRSGSRNSSPESVSNSGIIGDDPRGARKAESGKGGTTATKERKYRSSDSFFVAQKSQSGDYGIDKDNFRKHCEELKPFAKVQKSELSEEYYNKVRAIAELATHTYNNPLYAEMVEIVEEVFKDVEDPQPGSVAGFFRGCYSPSKFPGRNGCSATCAGNLPIPDYPGWRFCDKHVGIYRNGKFERCHQPVKDTDTILIHVVDKSFLMQQNDIDEMKESGITHAIVIPYNNGEYGPESKPVRISDLPVSSVATKPSMEVSYLKGTSRDSSKDSTGSSKDSSKSSKDSSNSSKDSSESSKDSSKSSKDSTKSSGESKSKCTKESKSSKSGGRRNECNDSNGFGWIIGLVIFIIIVIIILCALYYAWGGSNNYSVKSNEYVSSESTRMSTVGSGYMI